MNLASTRRNWPTGRGFERWYASGPRLTRYPLLVYDNHRSTAAKLA
jgi:arylsulfatase